MRTTAKRSTSSPPTSPSASIGDWGAPFAGSKSIVIWDSTDLVHWSPRRALVKVAPDDAGCTGRREAVCEDRKEYHDLLGFHDRGRQFQKHRIWAAWTRTFVTFGQPFVLHRETRTLIDTDIVRENGNYYRFSKDEQYKSITMEVSTNLMNGWQDATNFSLAKIRGTKARCYQIKPAANGKPATWCLILDQYSRARATSRL